MGKGRYALQRKTMRMAYKYSKAKSRSKPALNVVATSTITP
jgi:hypothetical protein